MDRLSHMPLGINVSHLFPFAPAVAYVMGGFDDAKKRFPNEKEMATIIGHYKEAVDAGAAGWSAQRLVPESREPVRPPSASKTISAFWRSWLQPAGSRCCTTRLWSVISIRNRTRRS